MPFCDVYIGDIDDPDFTWTPNKDQWNGNEPRRISGIFPHIGPGYGAFSLVINKIESGEFFGKKVDWSCWVAIVTKQQIIYFINELYDEEWRNEHSGVLSYMLNQLNEVIDDVNQLDPNKKYGLVASEL